MAGVTMMASHSVAGAQRLQHSAFRGSSLSAAPAQRLGVSQRGSLQVGGCWRGQYSLCSWRKVFDAARRSQTLEDLVMGAGKVWQSSS